MSPSRLTASILVSALCFAQSLPTIPLVGKSWTIDTWTYGLTRSHTVHLDTLSTGGVAFDFPLSKTGQFATYATTMLWAKNTLVDISAAQQLVVTFNLAVTGSPQFNWVSEPGNVCPVPAYMHPHFSAGTGNQETDRWWANPDAFLLQAGTNNLAIPLTGDRWSDVWGHFGNDINIYPDPQTGVMEPFSPAEGFQRALHAIAYMGATAGGGCFFGHGVQVISGTGTAQLQILRYELQ